MTFRPESLRSATGARQGVVEYRLARNSILKEFKRGRLSSIDICDAHPELMRAATHVGKPTSERCPVCEETDVVLVTYVFGSRLPAHGRCISKPTELAKLHRSGKDLSGYIVEVCPECRWNHLARSFPVGRQTT
ncbi:MAG: DUF5318 family protein [Acidimicrobiales bacterium]